MKNLLLIILVILFISLTNCSSNVVSTTNYDKTIIRNTVDLDIPQLQPDTEKKLFMDQKIKSMSFVIQKENEIKLDSITFLEFDFSGRLKYRTTLENTTQGCLPFMLRQEFIYDKNKIKKVIDHTFKYKTNSVLSQWLEKDTTRLRLFDWEDYSYIGDTIIVENGNSVQKFVKDVEGNIIRLINRMKTNNQIADSKYDYSGTMVINEIGNSLVEIKDIIKYYEESNNVVKSFKISDDEFKEINVYDEKGLLQSINMYLNGKKVSTTKINYDYYF
ncbi:MAG: hypothetical protein WAR79_19145 [Melioribacteraceae bacterium]